MQMSVGRCRTLALLQVGASVALASGAIRSGASACFSPCSLLQDGDAWCAAPRDGEAAELEETTHQRALSQPQAPRWGRPKKRVADAQSNKATMGAGVPALQHRIGAATGGVTQPGPASGCHGTVEETTKVGRTAPINHVCPGCTASLRRGKEEGVQGGLLGRRSQMTSRERQCLQTSTTPWSRCIDVLMSALATCKRRSLHLARKKVYSHPDAPMFLHKQPVCSRRIPSSAPNARSSTNTAWFSLSTRSSERSHITYSLITDIARTICALRHHTREYH